MSCKICPLHSTYKFSTSCRVTTCKNYTEVTASKCLALDVKPAADKNFSDSELAYYKFNNALKIAEVTELRKTAMTKVKSTLIINKIIEAIKQKKPKPSFFYVEGEHKEVDAILAKRPLSFKYLEFSPWMLSYLFDEAFVKSVAGMNYNVADLLELKTQEYNKLANIVNPEAVNVHQ